MEKRYNAKFWGRNNLGAWSGRMNNVTYETILDYYLNYMPAGMEDYSAWECTQD